MSQVYIGQIQMFGFNFAPRGFAFCNGQTLSISQYQALFALLGTTYGGNGTTNFALPDLRSRVPLHFGQGAGLSNYVQGEVTGVEGVTLNLTQMPTHTHTATATVTINASDGNADQTSPAGAYHAVVASGSGRVAVQTPNYTQSGSDVTMAAGSASSAVTVVAAGSGQSHTNIQPVLAINFCISLQGIFPSRN